MVLVIEVYSLLSFFNVNENIGIDKLRFDFLKLLFLLFLILY